jgi:hypothetical protein
MCLERVNNQSLPRALNLSDRTLSLPEALQRINLSLPTAIQRTNILTSNNSPTQWIRKYQDQVDCVVSARPSLHTIPRHTNHLLNNDEHIQTVQNCCEQVLKKYLDLGEPIFLHHLFHLKHPKRYSLHVYWLIFAAHLMPRSMICIFNRNDEVFTSRLHCFVYRNNWTRKLSSGYSPICIGLLNSAMLRMNFGPY